MESTSVFGGDGMITVTLAAPKTGSGAAEYTRDSHFLVYKHDEGPWAFLGPTYT